MKLVRFGACGRIAGAATRMLASVAAVALLASPGRADITLTPGPAFPINIEATAVAVADFDRDGLVDVAALEPGANGIFILFGDATRTLGRIITVPIASRLDAFTVGDVNGDTFVDIVAVTNATDSVNVSFGNGSGNFLAAVPFEVGRRPVDVAIADFDGARGNDLVVVSQDDDRIRVLLNRGGSSGFQSSGDLDVGNRPKRVGVGDLNGDGRDDIVVLNSGTPNDDDVSVFLNPGAGRFNRQVRYGVGPRAKDLTVTDTNNDGAPDIVVLNGKAVSGRINTFTLSVLLNRPATRSEGVVGTGVFDAAPDVNAGCPSTVGGVPVFCDPRRMAVGDFDGDGYVDLALSFTTLAKVGSLFTPGVLTALAGYGDGTFYSSTQTPVGARPAGLATTDFNGDHIPDLAVAEEGTSSIRIVLGLPPTQRSNGASCSSGLQCTSGFCTDGVCCTSESCPLGELCSYPGVEGTCSVEPTATASATPTASPTPAGSPVGAPCQSGSPQECADGLSCTDGRCCVTATCPAGQRCDVLGAAGQCTPPLSAGGACDKDSDCAPDLRCADSGDGRVCAAVATVTPTETPSEIPTETPPPVPTRTAGNVCTGACCAGDCDGDASVTVDEMLVLVAISLGDTDLSSCPAGDVNADGDVAIDDILAATNSALEGCALPP